MIKRILSRGVLGGVIGIFISSTITILISLIYGDGAYHFAVPALLESTGSDFGAVALQYILSFLMGAGIGASSLIWESETLSMLSQTALHFFILATSILPTAYFCYWMEHTLRGFLIYFGIFIGIYLLLWFGLTAFWKKRLLSINNQIDH